MDYPEIVDGVMPRHRFMSAYEQRVEPPDRQWQYLLFAAEPYETIAFKVGELLMHHCPQALALPTYHAVAVKSWERGPGNN